MLLVEVNFQEDYSQIRLTNFFVYVITKFVLTM